MFFFKLLKYVEEFRIYDKLNNSNLLRLDKFLFWYKFILCIKILIIILLNFEIL